MVWNNVFSAIGTAATNPRALAAYALALCAFVFLGYRERLYRLYLARLGEVPERERKMLLQQMIGNPLPPDMTAAQFIHYRRMQNWFGFGGVLVVVLGVLAVIALTNRAPSVAVVAPNPNPAPGSTSAIASSGGVAIVGSHNSVSHTTVTAPTGDAGSH